MSSPNNTPEDADQLGKFLESQTPEVSAEGLHDLEEATKPEEAVSPEIMRARVRTVGLAFIGLGLLIGLVTIGWPMLQAVRGVEEIWLTENGIIAAVAFALLGVAGMCGLELFEDEGNVTMRDMLMLAVLVAIGIATEWGIENFFTARGYVFD